MNKSDCIEIYVLADDSAGFTHKYSIYGWQDSSIYSFNESELMYDSNGELLTK